MQFSRKRSSHVLKRYWLQQEPDGHDQWASYVAGNNAHKDLKKKRKNKPKKNNNNKKHLFWRYKNVQSVFGNRWCVCVCVGPELHSSVTLTEASASTAQPGYWSAEGNCRFINVRMKSGKRPSMMLCRTDRMRLSCKKQQGGRGRKKKRDDIWIGLINTFRAFIICSDIERLQHICLSVPSKWTLRLLIAIWMQPAWRSLEPGRKCGIDEKMKNNYEKLTEGQKAMHNQAFMPRSPSALPLHRSQEESDRCFDHSWNRSGEVLARLTKHWGLCSGKNAPWMVSRVVINEVACKTALSVL